MQCVILCAGEGTRLGSDTPKPLRTVKGQPILYHIMKSWEDLVDGFVVVTGPKHLKRFEGTIPELTLLPTTCVTQELPRGIADAVLAAEQWVDDQFLVVLGDCLYQGKFNIPDADEAPAGIGVWAQGKDKDVQVGYGVQVDGNRVTKLVEKPYDPTGLLCGMGIYCLNYRMFDIIRDMQPSASRNEVEITDALQEYVDLGYPLKPYLFEGKYININLPEDLAQVQREWTWDD